MKMIQFWPTGDYKNKPEEVNGIKVWKLRELLNGMDDDDEVQLVMSDGYYSTYYSTICDEPEVWAMVDDEWITEEEYEELKFNGLVD